MRIQRRFQDLLKTFGPVMTIIPLYSVTYRDGRDDINVELHATPEAAIARREQITTRGMAVIVAEHGMRVGR
jgi:hypothetical protein